MQQEWTAAVFLMCLLSLMVFVRLRGSSLRWLPFCSCSSNSSFSLSPPANVLLHPLLLSFLSARSWPCVIMGIWRTSPPPPVRMSSTIFSGGGKDTLAANHSSKPLPSVPEERKRNKIISIFSGAEKGAYRSLHTPHPAASGSSRSRESRQTPEIHLQLICVQTLLLSLRGFSLLYVFYLLICLFHIQGCYLKLN